MVKETGSWGEKFEKYAFPVGIVIGILGLVALAAV